MRSPPMLQPYQVTWSQLRREKRGAHAQDNSRDLHSHLFATDAACGDQLIASSSLSPSCSQPPRSFLANPAP
eukprot:3342366-Rhodomonas_salina.1